jgi:hypothetical protein
LYVNIYMYMYADIFIIHIPYENCHLCSDAFHIYILFSMPSSIPGGEMYMYFTNCSIRFHSKPQSLVQHVIWYFIINVGFNSNYCWKLIVILVHNCSQTYECTNCTFVNNKFIFCMKNHFVVDNIKHHKHN